MFLVILYIILCNDVFLPSCFNVFIFFHNFHRIKLGMTLNICLISFLTLEPHRNIMTSPCLRLCMLKLANESFRRTTQPTSSQLVIYLHLKLPEPPSKEIHFKRYSSCPNLFIYYVLPIFMPDILPC